MKWPRLGIIVGAGILLTLPILIFGLPFLADDVGFHAAWYTHFSEQLWSGDFYPRWLSGMNGGLGSPVFFFYPPAPYFLTSVLRPLFQNDHAGLHQLGVSASFALMASGVTAYLWLRDIADKEAALVASVLYMAMPYHLAADLYVRGAFAEFWTFVWMPLVLHFTFRLAARDKRAFVGTAIAWALLIMTHLPTTLTFSMVPFAYGIFTAPRKQRLKVAGLISLAAMLAAGVAAIYLLPALTTQRFVFLDRMTTGYFSYRNWLFFAQPSLWREDKIVLALLAFDMAAIATCAFLIIRSNSDGRRRELSSLWYAIALAAILMMTELSRPLWWLIPSIQRVQFPWRFNTVLCVASAALMAMALSSRIGTVREELGGENAGSYGRAADSWLRSSRHSRAAKIIGLVFIIVWIPATVFKAWQSFPQTNPNQHDIAEQQEQIEQSKDAPEYRPRWDESMAALNWDYSTDEALWNSLMRQNMESLLQTTRGERGTQPIVDEGIAEAEITGRKPREIDLHVKASTRAKLNLPQFYYPYWSAHIVGETTALPLGPAPLQGLITITVPPGDHTIQLNLKRSKTELAGQLLSLASVAVALGLMIVWRRSKDDIKAT